MDDTTQEPTVMDEIARLHRLVGEHEDALTAVRRERDDLIRAAIAEGTSMYAIAKANGMSESNVRLIRDA